MLDVKDVAKGTPREDELFDYTNVPDEYKTIRTPLYEEEYQEDYNDYDYEEYDNEIDKDAFDISLQESLLKIRII